MRLIQKLTRRRVIFAVVIALIAVGVAGGIITSQRAGRDQQTTAAKKDAARYHCPMHPTYTSDGPGACPICGMDLVPIEDKGEESAAEMAGIEGLAGIKLSDAKRQLIGVRTTEVAPKPLTKTIRTVGVVEPDETRLAEVNMKIDGWIEKLYVDSTGQLVRKGQQLVSVYSQELYAAQQEYLVALKARKRLKNSPVPEVSGTADSLVNSARRRLELWDIPESVIRSLEKTGKAQKTVVLRAPVTGFVTHMNAREGVYAKAGEPLYRIADLSRVWVQADIYEYEMALLKVGQHAKLTVDAYPGRNWSGKVAYIYPFLEEDTRTLKVRFEFNNPGFALKPNMFANVELHIPLGTLLAVPEEAIVDTGKRQVVFVDNGEGYYEPREVKVGQQVDSSVEITYGLFEGERVVINGNFMIDSESRLKAALTDISGHKADVEEAPDDQGGHAGDGM